MARTYELNGLIASAGFASGDRIVVGMWNSGPLGPMTDLMWAKPDGTRVLIAPNQQVGNFVSAIYEFDEVLIRDLVAHHSRNEFVVDAGVVKMRLLLGRRLLIPFRSLRPPFVTRYIEGPIARRLLNVHTYGVTKSGVEEWYRASGVAWVRSGQASVDNSDCGAMTDITPLRVGVSEPPTRPSVVAVRPRLRDLKGVLE